MAIILNGTTGITTPDIDSIAGFDGEDLTGDVAAARITGALNATGSAPLYACRAWVNFNGTGTVAIRASGNVSSIGDLGTGQYRVNFAAVLSDANYAAQVTPVVGGYMGGASLYLSASVDISSVTDSGVFADSQTMSVSLIR